MKYILDEKEYQKLHQSNVDLKKHNKALKDKIKELQDRAVIKVDGDVKKETKSAEEMFKELGFRRTRYDAWFRDEEYPYLVNYRSKSEMDVTIDFHLTGKTISLEVSNASVEFCAELKQAINKQIQELGWE